MKIKVRKASGELERFNPEKLRASLIRSGADPEQTKEIIATIEHEIKPGSSTRKIYRLAKKYLRQINHASGLRYSLKRSLFRLGPSGYPFEKYIGEVLKNYGYETQTGIILDGKCVKHEIDVFGVNSKEVTTIECKYHNRTGSTTDIKVAMYIHSRFRDLQPILKKQYPGRSFKGWLITNTRCTSDAIKYAKCCGFHMTGWSHPYDGSLQKLIEEKKLYPATIISGVKSGLINKLFDNDIILLKDLADMDLEKIQKLLGLTEHKAVLLKNQAYSLCCSE